MLLFLSHVDKAHQGASIFILHVKWRLIRVQHGTDVSFLIHRCVLGAAQTEAMCV